MLNLFRNAPKTLHEPRHANLRASKMGRISLEGAAFAMALFGFVLVLMAFIGYVFVPAFVTLLDAEMLALVGAIFAIIGGVVYAAD